jgi:hypothetical protein
MASARIGKQTPRYTFILNTYPEERLSMCPLCRKPTHPRKFPLFVHVDAWGPLTLGKTTVYCARCELIIVHQADLEAELAATFGRLAPDVIGKPYMVLGTVDKSTWKDGLGGAGSALGDVLSHMADFKKVLTLEVEPGGWFPAERGKAQDKRRR